MSGQHPESDSTYISLLYARLKAQAAGSNEIFRIGSIVGEYGCKQLRRKESFEKIAKKPLVSSSLGKPGGLAVLARIY